VFGVERSDTHEGILAGMSLSGHERNELFLNTGAGADFARLSLVSGADSLADGRAYGLFDYDRDGWSDFAVVNSNVPGFELFHNRIGTLAGGNRVIALRLVGGNHGAEPSSEYSARDAYGARIRLEAGPLRKQVEHRSHDGYSAQNSATELLGIGAHDAADSLSVRWPSGREQSTRDVPAGSLVTVYENPAHSPTGEAFVVEAYAPARTRVAMSPPARSPAPPWLRSHALGRDAGLVMYTTMATWCAACASEVPQLDELRRRFGPAELAMQALPVDEDDSASMLEVWMAEHGPPYELVPDLSTAQQAEVRAAVEALAGRYAIPATLVTNRDGELLWAKLGPPSVSDIRRLIRQTSGT